MEMSGLDRNYETWSCGWEIDALNWSPAELFEPVIAEVFSIRSCVSSRRCTVTEIEE